MPASILDYDAVRRRLWVCGQRCHHGATGALVTGGAVTALAAGSLSVGGSLALAAVGSALMAHDWPDRGLWFVPGHQHQP